MTQPFGDPVVSLSEQEKVVSRLLDNTGKPKPAATTEQGKEELRPKGSAEGTNLPAAINFAKIALQGPYTDDH